MKVGILKEPAGETRVSLLPEHLATLQKWNLSVYVELGAGNLAFAKDEVYEQAGARVVDRNEVLREADVLLSIHQPPVADMATGKHTIWLGMYFPLWNPEAVAQWSSHTLSVFSLDLLPRTTRAQSMDVLSSQANIAGYKAVLLAANVYPRYFPMFMTAAGSIAPAKVLILGAGVAGLQAIATAKRLGAVVEVFDTRPAVKEEVMSLGAKFIEVEGAADASAAGGYAVEQSDAFKEKQRQRIAESVAKSDIIITTAQIPGKKAPLLITEPMINSMRNGSVIVDLAAATGGNTPFTRNNETVYASGVTIIGNSALSADMPGDASKLYGKNILNFLQLIVKPEGSLYLNFEDDLVKGTCMVHEGVVVHEKLKGQSQ
ncbi:MAG: Re/Si-specific NAD(P)(+) transhydrogenase subunit alpha [Ferruginibacter sp.]|nr:Re/Si-specific NAD(P)(+) transhydrogenase subunit alpha [Ferruginibacter sp.]